jgi:nitrous oxide reductase accessory protein NosL
MRRTLTTLVLATSALLAGCASGPPFIDQAQPEAVAMAQRRGAFELNCPGATAQVLSRDTLQPISFRFGIERAEYTIGVSGCGKRATYVVICPDQPGSTCFAAASRDGIL